MTTPRTHIPESPTVERSGPRLVPADRFPRRGVFCLVAGALAIVASIGKRGTIEIEEPDPTTPDGSPPKTRKVAKPYVDDAQPFAEVHLVEVRESHPNYGHFRRAWEGFPQTADGRISITAVGEVQERGGEIFNVPLEAIERAPWSVVGPIIDVRNGDDPKPDVLWASRAGYVLSDEEKAQLPALLGAEADERERTAYLAAHPDAKALEEEIEKDRVAFIQKQATRREELASRLLAERAAPPSTARGS